MNIIRQNFEPNHEVYKLQFHEMWPSKSSSQKERPSKFSSQKNDFLNVAPRVNDPLNKAPRRNNPLAHPKNDPR